MAAADLDAGHVLTRGDLSEAEVRASRGRWSPGSSAPIAARPVGRVLRTPVRAGAAIPSTRSVARVPAGRDVTIPVTPEHALGGAIRPGDRVDVYATFDKGTDVGADADGRARSATVRGVTRSDGLFGQQEGGVTAHHARGRSRTRRSRSRSRRATVSSTSCARTATLDGRGRERFDADSLR